MSGTLDEAWARAEATLPEQALIRLGRTGMTRTGWATAYLHGHHIGTAFSDDGPAAALNALTDRFEYRCGCTIHTDRGEVCPRPGPFCQECQDVCWGLVKPDSAYTAETARLLLERMLDDHLNARFYGPDCGVDDCQREVGHIGEHARPPAALPPALPLADRTLMSKSGSLDNPILALALVVAAIVTVVVLLYVYRVPGGLAGG